MATKIVTATDVREWAKGKGLDVAEHGRLPFDVIEAFNKGRKVKYASTMAQPTEPLRIEGKKADKAGRNRPVTYTITPADLRAWALDNGFPLGSRGRVPAEVIAAYAVREANPAKL